LRRARAALALVGVALLVLCSTAWAQTSASGSSPPDFPTLVAQDVAAGYYTQAQGDALIAQYDAALERVQGSLDKAVSKLQSDISLTASGNQQLSNQLGSLTTSQGNVQLGGTPEQVQQQAEAIFNAVQVGLQVDQTVLDDVNPVIQDALNEINQLASQRAALINGNPSLPAAVKFQAGQIASKVQLATEYTFQRDMSTINNQLQAAQAALNNNKQAIVANLENAIETNVAQYGSNPANWKAPSSVTQPAPQTANANPPAPVAQPVQSTPQPQTVAQKQGTTSSTKGTIPTTGQDPALSVTRNGTGTTGAGTTGTGNSSAGSGSQGTNTSGAGGAQAAAAGAAAGAAAAAAAGTTPSGVDPLSQLKPGVIQPLPIATPQSPTPPPPELAVNGPVILNPTLPPPPPGNGQAVNPNQPPATNGSVLAPTQNSAGLGLPTASAAAAILADVAQAIDQAISQATLSPGGNGDTSSASQGGTIPGNAPDPAFNAYRNYPNGVPPTTGTTDAGQTASAAEGVAQGAACAAGACAGSVQGAPSTTSSFGNAPSSASPGSAVPPPPGFSGPLTPAQQEAILTQEIQNQIGQPKVAHLVEGDELGTLNGDPINLRTLDTMQLTLMAMSADLQSSEYGSNLTVSLAPIYAGYSLSANPGSAMNSLNLQVQTPSSVMQMPSNQILVPSPLSNMPSSQLSNVTSSQLPGVPSDVMLMPTLQLPGSPGDIMTSLDLQPALCGR
jgi:hypothetical protein